MDEMNNVTLQITSIEQLKKDSSGEIVTLPPFVSGSDFVARLKRPSMLDMVKHGKIPNDLLTSANELFVDGVAKNAVNNISNPNMISDMIGVLECYCENAFVEPTYKELQDAGIKLTDEQMMFVFNYAQAGVKALKSFRE